MSARPHESPDCRCARCVAHDNAWFTSKSRIKITTMIKGFELTEEQWREFAALAYPEYTSTKEKT